MLASRVLRALGERRRPVPCGAGVNDRPAVRTYELDPVTKSYAITGIHHERLKLTVPFTIDIDLTQIDHM